MGASAMKAGLGRIALSLSVPLAALAGVCALMASVFATAIIVGRIAPRHVVQLTAAPEDSVWMENVSVKKALPEKIVTSSDAQRTAQGRESVPMGLASAKRAT